MSELAILGGKPVREKLFPAYKVIGAEEIAAVKAVMESNVLSRFLGTWHDNFYGGEEVRAFEAEWAAEFGAAHAVSVNSATSGLYAAVGASGAGPGDEVIVSPYTMVASATAAVVYNAVPVFADIDPRTFNMSPESIAAAITPRTKAIVVVHIFGQPADMDPIMALAEKHGIVVIEDCAQSPYATYKGRPVGTLGHMGVFSLNYHKHIHTGEGGVVTTNDPVLAEKLQLIRNHAEAVVLRKGVTDLVNMVGFNYRMCEIEAAIGRQQLKRGRKITQEWVDNTHWLEQNLRALPGLTMPYVPPENTHVYYNHGILYDAAALDLPRKVYVDAIDAELPAAELRESEGGLIGEGYVMPIYLMPMYQKLVGYGTVSCPFTCPHYGGKADYREGLCPNTEWVQSRLISHEFQRPPLTRADQQDVINAFHKVHENLPALRDYARKLNDRG